MQREQFPGNVSRETEADLRAYADLLTRWNRRINLVGPTTIDEIETRHIADSLQLLDHAPGAATSWLDMGTGAGLPGLVCAIAARHSRLHLTFTLAESDQRKVAFLREAARQLDLDPIIHAGRIETMPPAPFDIVTARALAPLPKLLDLAAPFTHPETVLLFPKGARAESELTAAAAAWHTQTQRFPSRTDPAATILKITGIQRRS